MKVFFCVIHQKHHSNEGGWRYREWETEAGRVMGWGCANVSYPEFIPQRVKDERVEYANDMLQSHRGGELSREYVEAYPERTKAMIKDGAITKEEVKKAKYVWKEVKGVKKKVDASMI
jgi:hypothetical protein